MLTLRRLRWSDIWFCWKLARDPVVRENSLDQSPPNVRGHLRWMRGWVNSPTHGALIVLIDGGRSGLVRDWLNENGNIEIGIAFVQHERGKGHGVQAIKLCVGIARFRFGYRPVIAWVRGFNVASIKAFERAGFTAGEERFGVVRMTYPAAKSHGRSETG